MRPDRLTRGNAVFPEPSRVPLKDGLGPVILERRLCERLIRQRPRFALRFGFELG